MSKSPVYIGAGSNELAVQAALNLIQDGIDSAAHLVTVADWVHADGTTVAGTAFYSAKEYAQGSTLAAGGSSKNWAQLPTTPTTTPEDASAKEWATGVSTHKLDASAKEYATHAKYFTVDGSSGYSAKHYSGQAQDWAAKTTIVRNDANGADVDYSSKQYAVGTPPDGSAKEWATTDTNAIAGGLFSAKQYAANSAASALAASNDLATFQSIFHGASTSTPSSNVSDGDLWFDTNTGVNVMKVYDLGNTTWVRTTPTTANQTQINTLTTGYDGTTTTSGTNLNIDQVDVVADNIGSVNTVATDIVKVVKVADDLLETVSEIETVALDLQETTSEIDTVANSIVNVNLVGDDIVKVNTVAGKDTEIGRIGTAPMAASIALLGTDAYANVSTGDIKLVADIDGDVTKVADIDDKVELVAAIDGEVELVAAVDGEIALLGTANMTHPTTGHLAYLGTAPMANTTNGYLKVLGNATVTDDMALLGATGVIGDIEIVSDNITDVSNFADLYQINDFSPVPTKDGGGVDNLAKGDLAFDTTDDVLRVYNGSAWSSGVNTTDGVIVKQEYTANGSTQHFALSHDQDMEIVYLNGVKLLSGDGSNNNDYFSVNGGSSTTYVGNGNASTHIYFHTAPTNTFVISLVAWGASSNTLAISKSGGTYSGAVTFSAGLITNTADINGGTLAAITIDGAWNAASQTCADLGTVTTGAFTTITNLGNVTTTGTVGLGGKLTAGSNEIEGSNFDINGGTLGAFTIDGNWTAASQTCADLGTVTTANIDGGTVDGIATLGVGTAPVAFGNGNKVYIYGDATLATTQPGIVIIDAKLDSNARNWGFYNGASGSGELSLRTSLISHNSSPTSTQANPYGNKVALTITKDAAIVEITEDLTVGGTINGTEIVTPATNNLGVGIDALDAITTGDDNTALGDKALTAVTDGNQNTAVGYEAGKLCTGWNNILLGWQAGDNLTSGSNNTIIGAGLNADSATADDQLNIMGLIKGDGMGGTITLSGTVGVTSALTVGGTLGVTGATTLAALSTNAITSGAYTINGIYMIELANSTYGDQYSYGNGMTMNYVANGTNSGVRNNAFGYNCLAGLTTGNDNTAMGFKVLNTSYAATYSGNTGFGSGALELTSGNYNTGVGMWTSGPSSGSNNTTIGYRAGTGSSPSGTIGGSSNVICLGDDNINALYCADNTIDSSDGRDKTDIEDFNIGLEWIEAMRPVTYHWDKRGWYKEFDEEGKITSESEPDGTHKKDKKNIGFIAQEVLEIEKAHGFSNDKDDMLTVNLNEDDTAYGIKYASLVPVLVNAIKELSAKVKALEAA